LRVCRADGAELLFDLRDKSGDPKRAGQLNEDDKLVVPVECSAHAETALFVYAGNARAWAVPDFLTAKVSDRTAGLGISIGPVERLQCKPAQPITAASGPNWRNWAAVRVRSFAPTVEASSLVRVNLRKAIA